MQTMLTRNGLTSAQLDPLIDTSTQLKKRMQKLCELNASRHLKQL